MASENQDVFTEVNVDHVVAKAVEEFKKVIGHDADDLLQEKTGLMKVIRQQAEDDAQLHQKLFQLVGKVGSAELEAAMSTILSQEHLQTIKDAFLFHTYQVQVYTCSNPVTDSYVKFLREGEDFLPDIKLVSTSDILEAKWIQWSSLVIELFMFVFSCVGIKVSLNARQMKKVTESVVEIVKMPAFKKALDTFKNAWSNGGNYNRAKAIFMFLKDSFTAGFFWRVAKTIFSEMNGWDYARAVASCTAMIVAAFATGGIAIIAKCALALDSAYALVQKMTNLEALEKVEQIHHELALKNLLS